MGDDDAKREYCDALCVFLEKCIASDMNEAEFEKMYLETLNSVITKAKQRKELASRPFLTTRKKFVIIIGIIILGTSIYNYETIYTTILSSLQDCIYPGLRLLRQLSIPLLSLFPAISDLYHETCLIQNPFFTVVDMDCWPCSSINNIRELHSPDKPIDSQHAAPFIYKTDQKTINIDSLKEIYLKDKLEIDNGAAKVNIDNSKYHTTPHALFSENKIGNELYTWKFNNMNLARILRQHIHRPQIVPKFGQSTERFIIIDSSQNKFKIPDTECNFSFLLALSGSRTINLMPAEECKHQCKPLKVDLKETYLLWYNWWYWRPVVQKSSSNVTFIAHIGSYC